MAKDPNYDRYAGIVSLPGADGKMPRPFRVDEDGNVIYRDEEAGIGKPMGARKARDLVRAGILDWDELDRRLDRQATLTSEDVLATASRGSAGTGSKGNSRALTRKTIGGIDYNVMSANTFDPARSSGRTVMPNADVIAKMNADINQIAVTNRFARGEKGTRIIGLPMDFSNQIDDRPPGERNLPLTAPKSEMYYSLPVINPKTKSIDGAETLSFGDFDEQPVGTVAYGHGHIDKGDYASDGMIDYWAPSKKVYGDVMSLLADNPAPMATVSEGRLAWHQLEDGRLQFMYPAKTPFSDHEAEEIQKNLNLQQSLFHR